MKSRQDTAVSKMNEGIDLTADAYVITLISYAKRYDKHTGNVGALVIEGLDNESKPFTLLIGCPFGGKLIKYQVSFIKDVSQVQRPSLTDKGILQSWKRNKQFVLDANEVLKPFLESAYLAPEANFSNLPDYSLKKLLSFLEDINIHLAANQPPGLDEVNYSPARFNPFARLIENEKFKTARLFRSSFWTRIKDTFFILNGSVGLSNEWGILDYVFPPTRFFTYLLALPWLDNIIDEVLAANLNMSLKSIMYSLLKQPLAQTFVYALKAIIAIPMAIGYLARTAVAAVLTVAMSPLIGIMNLSIWLSNYRKNKQIDNLIITPIDADLEDIRDLKPENDLINDQQFGSYLKCNRTMVIKPIVKDTEGHYDEAHYATEHKMVDLGLFDAKTMSPKGIIQLDNKHNANRQGLFALLQKNECEIDEHLEKVNAMDSVLNYIKNSN